MPYRFPAFLGSTLRIFPASTDNMGISNLTTMVHGNCVRDQQRLRPSNRIVLGGVSEDEFRQAGLNPEAKSFLEDLSNWFRRF